jgi:polyisoprenoid-binding protein YceI
MKPILLFSLVLAMLAPLDVIAKTYTLAPSNTTIQFKVRNLGIMHVTGNFLKFTGTVVTDETDLTKSKVDVSIETASIDTGINKRDKHLRSEDFFEVGKFPTMKFVATTIEKDGADHLKLSGNLTIKGITKPVVLLVTPATTDDKEALRGLLQGATATTTVNRKDFGVSWGAVIGDEVTITVTTHLNKQ